LRTSIRSRRNKCRPVLLPLLVSSLYFNLKFEKELAAFCQLFLFL
jgi:hypothetical protein